MKLYFFYFNIAFILLAKSAMCQKKVLDMTTFCNWPSITGDSQLSDDGNFVIYTVINQPIGSQTIYIQSTKDNWRKAFINASSANFLNHSNKALIHTDQHKILLLTLNQLTVEEIDDVSDYECSTNGEVDVIAYRTVKSDSLFVLNLKNGNTLKYSNIKKFQFGANGTGIFVEQLSAGKSWVNWLDYITDRFYRVCMGQLTGDVIIDKIHGKAAILTINTSESTHNKFLWYYQLGSENGECLSKQFDINRLRKFSNDGAHLYFDVTFPEVVKASNGVQVDIWNYQDVALQSRQLSSVRNGSPVTCLMVADLSTNRISQIDSNKEVIVGEIGNTYLMLLHADAKSEFGGEPWVTKIDRRLLLVNILNGKRKALPLPRYISQYFLTPNEHYVVYYDPNKNNYYSYNITDGAIQDLTSNIKTNWTKRDESLKRELNPEVGIVAWGKNDEFVLICDNNDVWQVFLNGRRKPICITYRFGNLNQLVFTLPYGNFNKPIVNTGESLLVKAINQRTKDEGFYETEIGRAMVPKFLYMTAKHIEGPEAGNDNGYLVRMSTASCAPNLFFSRDLKNYSAISNVHPENDYHWLKAELVKWKSFNGQFTQGVLYKPDDFDPKKKYPLIISYYEAESDKLNHYFQPEPVHGWINIPWFVSRGYLVFCPDICYDTPGAGQSAFNSIVSGARYLSENAWIDKQHIGIQGHSFGGYETNYLITHTTMFAAAMASSGVSDLVSAYGSIGKNGGLTSSSYYEIGQGRMTGTLWARQGLYIDGSPVLRADRVTTPLLLMNNKEDAVVDFSQGVEFFNALRRLGKKVWMLQYDNEGHSLLKPENSIDLTQRTLQFFDHYLKGASAPKWMVEGVPAYRKGIDDGLELEPLSVEPGPGLLTPKEQKKRLFTKQKGSYHN